MPPRSRPIAPMGPTGPVPWRPPSTFRRLARYVIFHGLRLPLRLGLHAICGVRVAGEEHVPARGGLIVAANHLSLADPVVLQVYVPRFLTYLMTDKFYYVPVLNQLVRFWGALVVKEGGMNKETLRAAEAVLARGGAIGIFPEGGITRQGGVREAQQGVALLALRACAPILPVGIAGTERLLPPDGGRLHRAPLSICIGEPIAPEPAAREVLAGRVTEAIRACVERAQLL